jgi:tripartite-type tricarboxylate transporter receptor subunit TctC
MTMMINKNNIMLVTALLLVLALNPVLSDLARAQVQYPSKTIQILLPLAVGTAGDLGARKLAGEITRITKQSVIVDNKPGASGFIGAQAAARAPADGYTVFITSNTTHAANQSLFKQLPYSPEKDFAPVTLIAKIPLVLVVRNESPIKTVADLVQLMRSRPGKITFASGSSSTRAGGELLKMMTKCEAVHVPYKGDPAALVGVMGGEVDFMTVNPIPASPLIKSGKIRPIAVTSTERVQAFSNIPTVRETKGYGLENYEMTAWSAAFVPAHTPAEIVSHLNNIFRTALKAEDVIRFYTEPGGLVTPSTPEELGQFVRSETEKWAEIVKAAGIEPE